MDYWQQSDHALETEYEFGQAVLMVNKMPLVEMPDPEKNQNSIRLVTFKVRGKQLLRASYQKLVLILKVDKRC